MVSARKLYARTSRPRKRPLPASVKSDVIRELLGCEVAPADHQQQLAVEMRGGLGHALLKRRGSV
jgi:hypothetical protein